MPRKKIFYCVQCDIFAVFHFHQWTREKKKNSKHLFDEKNFHVQSTLAYTLFSGTTVTLAASPAPDPAVPPAC